MSIHLKAFLFLALVGASQTAVAQDIRLPQKEGSLKFAIIGDTGTASREQSDVGRQMALYHAKFPFELVIMVGDNIYGTDTARDFQSKFEGPYKGVLDSNVKFYASLGNHDNPNQRNYKFFNMGGLRFYTFKPQQGVRFFAIDSNYVDKMQLDWLEKELAASGSEWKICFFHHPLYSSARRHGSSLDLRKQLEPIFVQYGVDVVFSGHDHTYERIKPQKGIHYFVSGSGGALRKGDLQKSDITAVGFDQDFHFMIAEIDGDTMHFQAVSRTGAVVDAGSIVRPRPAAPAAAPSPTPTPSPVAVAPSPTPSPSPTPKAAPKKRAPTRKKKPVAKR